MQKSRRLQYLDALGIDTFVPRCAQAVARSLPLPAPGEAGMSPDWQPPQAEVSVCVYCALHRTRTRTVFGAGSPPPDWPGTAGPGFADVGVAGGVPCVRRWSISIPSGYAAAAVAIVVRVNVAGVGDAQVVTVCEVRR